MNIWIVMKQVSDGTFYPHAVYNCYESATLERKLLGESAYLEPMILNRSPSSLSLSEKQIREVDFLWGNEKK